jgi:hypothetical protein
MHFDRFNAVGLQVFQAFQGRSRDFAVTAKSCQCAEARIVYFSAGRISDLLAEDRQCC